MTATTRMIGIVSGKGGVGKTTVTANLGAMLAREFGKSVIAVDCNFTTAHLGIYLGMHYCPLTLNSVLRGDAYVTEAMYAHSSGMTVIPAGISIRDMRGVDITDLRKVVDRLAGRADFVLLDSAPGLDREAMVTMRASDEILFVTNPLMNSVLDVIRCYETVKERRKKALGVVLNMVHNKRHEFTTHEIEGIVELPILAKLPFDHGVHKSLKTKVPIVMSRPNSSISREFRRLASHLVGVRYREPSMISKVTNGILTLQDQF